jgi:thiol-disulfide isomerase/thioredoxin
MLTRILALLLLTAATASAENAADIVLGHFLPYGQLEAKLDSRTLDDAEMFFSDRAGAYLLTSSAFDQPLLIDTRSRKVNSVDAAKLRRNGNGTVDLLVGAVAAEVGPFEVGASRLTIALAGGTLTMAPKPPLLGAQTAAALEAHDPSYAYTAGLYPPSESVLAELRQETRDVAVRVYFGSWCSTCSRVVPWLLRVDRALAGSRIRFEYYGLPPAMDDPEAFRANVDGVPTMVVTVGGREIGRRAAPDLGVPEKALLEILGGG